MAISTNSDLWHHENSGGKRFAAAIGVSVAIELAALGVLLPWMSHPTPNPSDHPSPIKISIIAPSPPKPPTPKAVQPPPKPIPPPPVPVTAPTPLPPPPPRPSVHRVAHRPPPPRHVIQPPVVQPPVVQTPPTPPPPAAPPQPSAGELDIFRAAMRRAVETRAVGIEPQSAEMAHEVGVTRIQFTYLNGAVSNVVIIASSGFPLLDQAAVAAAQTADYPPQPPDFAGRPDSIIVDVVFQATATSVDSD